jgi:hypothetical protein
MVDPEDADEISPQVRDEDKRVRRVDEGLMRMRSILSRGVRPGLRHGEGEFLEELDPA